MLITITKEVRFNRLNRDFDAYLDGRYVGSRATRIEAEELLDQLAYEMLMHQPVMA
jgi:hypothetical protein